jgi:hypothetical protein
MLFPAFLLPGGFIIFLIGLFLCVIVGVAASARGRNGFGWFMLSLFITPLLAVLLVVAMPKREQEMELYGRDLLTKRKCPYCFSIMPATAPVCAACTRESAPLTQARIEEIKRQVPAF